MLGTINPANVAPLQASFLVVRLWRIRAMAIGAILRGRLVEENLFGGDFLKQLVTLTALYVLVSATQGEGCALVMIEQRRLPLHGVVAIGAGGSVPFGKLLSVDVLVAVFAQHGCCLEIHINHFGFEIGRLVAIDAGCRAVGALQGELGSGMVKSGELSP